MLQAYDFHSSRPETEQNKEKLNVTFSIQLQVTDPHARVRKVLKFLQNCQSARRMFAVRVGALFRHFFPGGRLVQ